MTSPLVSILIPCCNAERYVAEAIRSALAQQYEPTEVIVVDDGSTDGSLQVIKRFADAKNFRWETGPNRGGNVARNRLLHMAEGEFVQFLDADDLLLPAKIDRQLNAFQPGIDAVFCNYVEFFDDEQDMGREVRFPHVGDDLLSYFISHSVITMLPIHRRSVLLDSSGFDESLPCCQEYELCVRLAANHWQRVVYLPEPLCRRRRLPTSVSANEERVYLTQTQLLGKWYEELARTKRLTPPTIDAIATTSYICGRHLARRGKRVEATEAFRLAQTIAPNTNNSARWPLRALAYMVGPYHAERLRCAVTRRA